MGLERSGAVLDRNRMEWLDRQMSTPAIGANAISQFLVESNATTKGVDVSFRLTNSTGISSVALLRAPVMDIKQAVVLQTWNATVANFTWSDTDSALQRDGQVFYWLRLEPVNANTNGVESIAGPQFILLHPSLLPPMPIAVISASHAAASNGTVLVTCNVSEIASGDSIKIYVSGYEGNASDVAVAQSSSAPLQFTLNATGETVTIKAIEVSQGGAEAASGPTTTLLLNGGATPPAQVQNITVAQIATGNQITWPASVEFGVTSYLLYRGQRGDVFTASSLLATISATTEGTVEYLDTAGLTGDFQYFLIAESPNGNSPVSLPANPQVLFSSSQIPANVPTNTTNTATVDSVVYNGNALVRIYGPGGVGTSYTRLTGFGTLTRPYGSISGLALSTAYYVMYDSTKQSYLASTSYSQILPDYYEWVGVLTTTGPTTATGSGATATAVIDANGHVIQINPTADGSGYAAATVNISGGGGTNASATATVSGGAVTSYTVTNGGTGYTSAPTVAVVAVASTGTSGGGGSGGTYTGCVEEGTFAICPDGTTEDIVSNSDWVCIDLGKGALKMHPETLVSVWKKASEIGPNDRIEVTGGNWATATAIWSESRESRKVKRTCPGGTYHAGPSLVRLHNLKPIYTR